MKYFILMTLLFLSAGCTHHTVTQQYAMPPEIVAVNAVAGGYEIVARAMNPETLLAGYSLHTGTSAENATNNSNGVHCSGLTVIPNVPVEYIFEVNNAAGVLPGRICKFSTTLTSGQYVTIRSLLFSINTDLSSGNIVYSPPSNAALVP